jgi:hypothetical protein
MAFKRGPKTITKIIIKHASGTMNKLKQYEQLIADKLQQLPLPDKDEGWQQMKKLLDEQLPPKTGSPWWKWGSLIAVVLTIGLWWFSEHRKSVSGSDIAQQQNKVNNPAQIIINTIKGKNTINAANNFTPVISSDSGNHASAEVSNISIADTESTTNANNSLKTNNTSAISSRTINNKNKPAAVALSIEKTHSNNIDNATDYTHSIDAGHNVVKLATEKGKPYSTVVSKHHNSATLGKRNAKPTTIIKEPPASTISGNDEKQSYKQQFTEPDYKEDKLVSKKLASKQPVSAIEYGAITINKQHERVQTLAAIINNQPIVLPAINTEQALQNIADIETIVANRQQYLTQSIAKQKELDKLIRKTARRDRFRNGLDLSYKPFSLKSEGQHWWAVGIAMNNASTTGSQARVNYNINARPNLALDYLPSPYVQYHVNDNVYVQTEINLSAPQHIPRILTSQNNFFQGTNPIERSVFVQKLYYFNWPFSLHYSPFNNLYLGAGIQFSSLQSGVVLIQERNMGNNALKNRVLKFKDDSSAAGFRPNEWRWQAGADYYWNRFTLGMRYNQAFNKLIINPAFTQTGYINNSLLLFLRYNLFEGRRKER